MNYRNWTRTWVCKHVSPRRLVGCQASTCVFLPHQHSWDLPYTALPAHLHNLGQWDEFWLRAKHQSYIGHHRWKDMGSWDTLFCNRLESPYTELWKTLTLYYVTRPWRPQSGKWTVDEYFRVLYLKATQFYNSSGKQKQHGILGSKLY